MLEPAVVLLRLVQYAGATVLMGSSLFFIYALPKVGPASAARLRWPRRLLAWSAVAVLFGTLLGLVAQTAVLAGSLEEGLKPSSLQAIVSTMGLGRASLVRAAAGAVALAGLWLIVPGPRLWLFVATMGVIAVGSFPWMGHGAASEGVGGLVHLLSDMVHGWAAAIWVGALAAFLMLLLPTRARSPEMDRALHAALHGFSGIGSGVVAALVASGLINSWFLVGPDRIDGLLTTPYGQLLLLKVGVFALMLVLAAINRFRLTPRLGGELESGATGTALRRLKRSLLLETAAAVLVLTLVAWLGTLTPVTAQ